MSEKLFVEGRIEVVQQLTAKGADSNLGQERHLRGSADRGCQTLATLVSVVSKQADKQACFLSHVADLNIRADDEFTALSSSLVYHAR